MVKYTSENTPSNLQLINEKQLHRIIGRSLSSIRKDRISGKGVNFLKHPSGSVYYDMRDVIDFIENNKRQFTSQNVNAKSNKTPNFEGR